MGLFLQQVYRLMSEKGLTYQEACGEIGRHGAKRRKANRRRKAGQWIAAKPIEMGQVHLEPRHQPGPVEEHQLEQTFLELK